MKILIVEDQKYTLEALEHAVKSEAPKYIADFQGYDVAKHYDAALESLKNGQYGLVLLDHRMPWSDVGNLEETDMDAFCDKLQNVGYGLIPQIRREHPQAVIVGTSSLGSYELAMFGKPDYRLDKLKASVDLKKILAKLKEEKRI